MESWVSKISPYSSPTEGYGLFDKLSWCRPAMQENRSLTLDETLAGDRFVKSTYNMSFREPLESKDFCKKSPTVAEIVCEERLFVQSEANRV